MTDIQKADERLDHLKPVARPTYLAFMALAIAVFVSSLISGGAYYRANQSIESNCLNSQRDREVLVDMANRLSSPLTLGPNATPEQVVDQENRNAEATQYREETFAKLRSPNCKGLSDLVATDPKPIKVPDPLPGTIGATGAAGVDGLTGRPGLDGKDGKDGIGIDGRDGRDGKDGRDGADSTVPGPKGDKGDPGEPAPTSTSTSTTTTTTEPPPTTTTTCVVCIP